MSDFKLLIFSNEEQEVKISYLDRRLDLKSSFLI